tara:strand:- start:4956 stop:5327 length:372 start_codon:yes stop_codon:yes gene_type:complete
MAVGLSMACVIHCFLAPSIIILAYGVSSFSVESELLHYAILMLAAPISIFALTLGYKNHKKISVLIFGILGLIILSLAIFLENIVGQSGEKALTLLGSIMLALSHFKNHQICKELDCSKCHKR